MIEATIRIENIGKKPLPLPMGGKDEKGNQYAVDSTGLLKNGRRFLPVMGEFHFSRYEPGAWEEELLKMRAGGVTVVASYVLWIHHEEKEGEWDFSGCRNLRAFLEICRSIRMPVWLRIGPWAHGECRNGGFPDWVANSKCFLPRSNDPGYLQAVERLYTRLGEEAQGMMWGDGGPILGIQLENEFGHCGGPSDPAEGMAHMLKLKELALKAGFRVPYYTATGWGGAYVPEGEALPVLGGYVDAPWATHVEEMPACEGFLFSSYKLDETIGSDLGREEKPEFTFDIRKNPYFTAELGGGLQVTAHRRTYPWPVDSEAQALCYLGGGANLLGYYMYHGGINPDGKYSTLQESRETGYANDLPVKSYDFQACIRESGEINESFGRLKRLHLFLQDFGEVLAGADPFFPEVLPSSPEDLDTLRVAARVNIEEGVGFLFLNNHQRKRHMKAHEDFTVRLLLEGGGERLLSGLSLPSDACAVIPFLLPGAGEKWKSSLPAETNASLLCRLGERLFFYTDGWEPACRWDGTAGNAVFLSAAEASRAFRAGGKLYITERPDSCLIEKAGKIRLITKAVRENVLVYGETGEPQELTFLAEPVQLSADFSLQREQTAEDGSLLFREYLVKLESVEVAQKGAGGCLHELYLELPYEGDRAELYLYKDGKLLDDWFTNGETWHVALRRFGYPGELLVRVYASGHPISNPYGNRVYYDLPVVPGCALHDVRLLPEYELKI
jgi:beta-galactosidase